MCFLEHILFKSNTSFIQKDRYFCIQMLFPFSSFYKHSCNYKRKLKPWWWQANTTTSWTVPSLTCKISYKIKKSSSARHLDILKTTNFSSQLQNTTLAQLPSTNAAIILKIRSSWSKPKMEKWSVDTPTTLGLPLKMLSLSTTPTVNLSSSHRTWWTYSNLKMETVWL